VCGCGRVLVRVGLGRTNRLVGRGAHRCRRPRNDAHLPLSALAVTKPRRGGPRYCHLRG
jgi:hypothetical protein